MRPLIRVLFVVGLMSANSAVAQTNAGAVPLLVSTAWLQEHFNDPELVILYTDQGAHDEALIPGARIVRHESLMTMQGGHGLAPTGDLVDVLERAGVSNASHVVVYGEPLSAGWLFFVLDHLGHARVSMLDGGILKWRAEERPIARTPPAVARGTFTPSARPRAMATAADLPGRRDTGNALILDARTAGEYRAGHIPGAALLTWQDVFADTRHLVFKSRDEIAALFRAAGAGRGPVVTYCQIGLRSSALYFAARYAGFDAANYVGSWSDWTARGLPVDRSAPAPAAAR
jgi:thiosulfate/3-mercaptopyruvate sulfurtransferase